MQASIQHQSTDTGGRFFLGADGNPDLAEMSYRRDTAQRITIVHTEVDPSLRGQGVGRALLDALVAWARNEHLKVVPQCSYAKAQFDRDASIGDVLA